MAAKNLHQKILDDYAANADSAPHPSVVEFCDYATSWLQSAGVIGLGYTAAGMVLRLRDGSELTLCQSSSSDTAQPAVSITGNTAGLQTTTPSRQTDVSITGT